MAAARGPAAACVGAVRYSHMLDRIWSIVAPQKHPFTLESVFSTDECVRRLRATVAEKGIGFFSFGDFDSRDFYGKIVGNKIELRKPKSFFWRNDFAPHMFISLFPAANGTRVKGYFGVASRVSAFLLFWMSFAGIIGGIIFVNSIGTVLHEGFAGDDDQMVGLIVPPAMLIFGFLLPRLCYYFSYWHERELMGFVRETLLAKEANNDTQLDGTPFILP